jgi:hypothetical protein
VNLSNHGQHRFSAACWTELTGVPQSSGAWAQNPAMRMNKVLPGKARQDGNSFVVNEGAPDLFPVMSLVKEWCTRREASERRAFALNAIFLYNTLKLPRFLCLTNCPLNSI